MSAIWNTGLSYDPNVDGLETVLLLDPEKRAENALADTLTAPVSLWDDSSFVAVDPATGKLDPQTIVGATQKPYETGDEYDQGANLIHALNIGQQSNVQPTEMRLPNIAQIAVGVLVGAVLAMVIGRLR